MYKPQYRKKAFTIALGAGVVVFIGGIVTKLL